MSHTLNIQTIIQQLDNGSTIRLFDATGVADGTSYEDGWSDGVNSTHNPEQSDIDQVVIAILYGDISHSVTLISTDLANYLNPMIGKSFSVADVLGAAYEYFEDGIYSVTITFSGATIQGIASAWTAYDEFQEAFIWTLRNNSRLYLAELKVPIENYVEAFKASLINVLLDDIYFLAQFGSADKAKDVMDYLTSVFNNETKLTELFKNYKNYE